ncbi:DUF397 domain-containing protein [Streptomyces sp. NPDC050523]|uniref:DUF397 domain-containing protein n=1 Tax=Streptomyces sp. NPDC050523 TaxID=3365622 RepID=UPI0037A1EED1
MTAPATAQWFKSSYSGGSGTECLECADGEDSVLIRDSKGRRGPVMAVSRQTWRDFVEAVNMDALKRREDH